SRPWNNWVALVLPTITLVIAVAPYVSRIMRASMIEVLESDYVEMTRLKGMPGRTVMVRHALQKALVPVVKTIALKLSCRSAGLRWGWAGSGLTGRWQQYEGGRGELRRHRQRGAGGGAQPRPARCPGAGHADRGGVRDTEPARRRGHHPGHAEAEDPAVSQVS